MTNFFIKIGKLLVCLFFLHSTQAQSNLVFNPSLEDTLSIRPLKSHYNSLGDTLLNCKKWYKTDFVYYHNYGKINYVSLKKPIQNESFEGECHVTLSVSNLDLEKWYMNSFITGTLKRKLQKDSLYQINYHFKPNNRLAYSFTKLNFYIDSTYVLDPFKDYKTSKNINYSIVDKNWIKATTTFKATGNEKYITIGYFKGDILTYSKNGKFRKKAKGGVTLVDLVEVTPLYKEPIINTIKEIDSQKVQHKNLELFFDHNSSYLSEIYKNKLELVLNNKDRIKKITIYGFASKVGSNDYNLKLANQRILAVKKHLLSKRIDVTIETNPFGTMHNLTGNLDEQRKVLIIFE